MNKNESKMDDKNETTKAAAIRCQLTILAF